MELYLQTIENYIKGGYKMLTQEQRQALEQEILSTQAEMEQVIKNAQTIAAQYQAEIDRLRLKQSALLAALEE